MKIWISICLLLFLLTANWVKLQTLSGCLIAMLLVGACLGAHWLTATNLKAFGVVYTLAMVLAIRINHANYAPMSITDSGLQMHHGQVVVHSEVSFTRTVYRFETYRREGLFYHKIASASFLVQADAGVTLEHSTRRVYRSALHHQTFRLGQDQFQRRQLQP